MSIPLSSYRPFTEQDSCVHGTASDADTSVNANDIFLDPDERYSIYTVKSAERAHLLHYISSEVKDESDIPALIDGCDLPGWRKENFIPCTADLQSVLNIGASSTMFRRERQWSICRHYESEHQKRSLGHSNSLSSSPWDTLKKRLLSDSNIRRGADVIHHSEYKEIIEIECDQAGVKVATRFALEYEQENIPAKILGATEGWRCIPMFTTRDEDGEHFGEGEGKGEERTSSRIVELDQNLFTGGGFGGWTFATLLQRFGHVYWRFSDTHGEMMPLGTYAKYITNLEGILDDSPLGIYDSEFGSKDSPTHVMVNEYIVPSCFSPDLFDLADSNCSDDSSGDDIENDDYEEEHNRPPYQWILIGPGRSGTGMHIDPLWTNAWVTVVQGKKRWMLFPPSVPLSEIGMVDGMPQINSATWFKYYYDKVTSDEWPEAWRPVEVLQYPGETVFVPNGWPHLVLNLELTVAVTHNYASEFGPFARMWKEVLKDEPDFAKRWMKGMKEKRPDLVKRLQRNGSLID